MIGSVWGPIGRSIPSLISGLPARPMPTIRPSLIPMSALTTPTSGRRRHARDDDIQLGRPGGPVLLGHPRAEVLGVAPQRLVARGREGRARRGARGPCRRSGPGRRSSGRSGRGRCLAGTEAGLPSRRRLAAAARRADRRAPRRRRSGRADLADLAGRPADGVAGRDVEPETAGGLAVERSRGLTRSNG